MDTPRFSSTFFSINRFVDFAGFVERRHDGKRYITTPHPVYVVLGAEPKRENRQPLDLKHVGWQSIVVDGDEPVALIEAAPDAMGELQSVMTIYGDLSKALLHALAKAEDENLLNEQGDFAVIAAPQVRVNAVWIPSSDTLFSIGPDVHRDMPQLESRSTRDLAGLVHRAKRSAR